MSFGWLELLLLVLWVTGHVAWERWKVRRIREEGEADRRRVHEIFESLRKDVEGAHER